MVASVKQAVRYESCNEGGPVDDVGERSGEDDRPEEMQPGSEMRESVSITHYAQGNGSAAMSGDASLIEPRASFPFPPPLVLPTITTARSLPLLPPVPTLDGRSSAAPTTTARDSSIATSPTLVHYWCISLVGTTVNASSAAVGQGAVFLVWYDVALEDVVANKHLPPLSAQDFEDYLKFAEGAVQNLYFYLWLQRYRSLHNDWASAVLPTVPSTSTGGYRPRDLWERLNPCQDRALKEEFAFAKSRWLDRGAPTRLDIPEEVRRAVLDIPNLPPRSSLDELTHRLPSFPNQPSPSHFDGLLEHVKLSLQSAFTRFLRIAFSNGGLWHACIGHVGSTVLFLAPGLALWTLGVSSGRRGLVAGSLALLWLGFSLALMCLNKHCFAIYATGDARQLYPYENIRPLPSEHANPPPVYSFGVPPQADDHAPPPPPPPYEPRLSRKTSGLLSIMSGVTVGKRPSGNGVSVGMSNRRDEEDEAMETGGVVVELDTRRTMERAREMDLRLPLPPARKTKDLPLRSLGPETLHSDPQRTADMPELRVFTEEEDFGIVVSEAYEEDEVYPFPLFNLERTQTTSANENETGTETAPGSSGLDPLVSAHLEPPTPCSVPEPTSLAAPAPVHSRRGAMGDIFSFGVSPPRPSKSPVSPALEWVLTQARPESKLGDIESGEGVVLMDPHWRSLFGPMTLVRDPLVRRAHWAVTVRSAIVGGVVVCGMAFGLIR